MVIFTAPERDVAKLDIAAGPWVPIPGRRRPLASAWGQLEGVPHDIEVLARVLLPEASGTAFAECRRDRGARLCIASDPLVDVLADMSRTYHRRPKGDLLADEWRVVLSDIAARWQAGGSHTERQTDLVELDVSGAAWEARRARDKDQRLYFWFGQGAGWVPDGKALARVVDKHGPRPA